jgi:hypothetical protein
MRMEEIPLDEADGKRAIAFVVNPNAMEWLSRLTGPPADWGAKHMGGAHLGTEEAGKLWRVARAFLHRYRNSTGGRRAPQGLIDR